MNDKKTELDDLINEFREQCWKLKGKYTQHFKEAFVGYGNSKQKFMNKMIEMADKKDPKSFEELIQRKEALFDRPLVKVDLLNKIESTVQFENEEILRTKIIGAEDVDIAELISKLSISDWVLQGHKHMENTDGVCPFCQQALPEELSGQLNRYFDRTYSEQISNLTNYSISYKSNIETIRDQLNQLKKLMDINNSFIDTEKIQDNISLIEAKSNDNINLIDNKIKEPSNIVSLKDIFENLDEINMQIEKANTAIKDYNALVINAEKAKKELFENIWIYLCEQNKINYNTFKEKKDKLSTEIEGRDNSIKQKEKYKKVLEEDLLKLQKNITNTEHSVNEINSRLNSFGFTNFKLDTAKKEGHYKIVRENGKDVEDTLSEGEKTFITFLYFYNLLRGSTDREEVSIKKTVVIDDPISSLDSNVLFIVSNLIRQVIDEVRNNSSDIKQLIILTHNIYFHKEVSFNKHNEYSSDETFWIIRKPYNRTSIQQYDENPIKSSYELLWNELKLLKDQSLITTQNVMRRILENYFKFFGGIDLIEILDKFEDEDKVTCRSLLTWTHDGSHNVNDDLFVERSTDIVEKYLSIFKDIFYKMGHHSHYDMMMKDFSNDDGLEQNENQKDHAEQEVRASVSQVASTTEE